MTSPLVYTFLITICTYSEVAIQARGISQEEREQKVTQHCISGIYYMLVHTYIALL